MVTKETLINFETEIGDIFNNGKIKAPIHLYHGNEDEMISIFSNIDIENDWVCCTWRNHYQALLKGIPSELLKQKIINGKSMIMNLPEYKFICSSIVGGIPAIAAGIAMAIKLQNKTNKVWCWVGDMSAETGAFHEAYKYSVNHKLPITFIVEDNKKSVCTPTPDIWKRDLPYYLNSEYKGGLYTQDNLIYYQYDNKKYPHAGAGKRVQF
jgi:TPP-dependent pyruvate/acetoin dehydrogenase alpha subunit